MKEPQSHQEEEVLGKAYDVQLIRQLLRYVAPYRSWLIASILLLFLTTGMQLLGPYITKVAIDTYIAARDLHGLNLAVLAYLITVLIGFLSQYAQSYTMQYTGQRAMHDLRTRLFTHVQRQDLAFFDKNPVGRLMTRIINDIETLNELFGSGVSCAVGRSLDAGGGGGGYAGVELAPGPHLVYHIPVHAARDGGLSQAGARQLSRQPANSGPHECVPPGEYLRDGHGPDLRSGGASL